MPFEFEPPKLGPKGNRLKREQAWRHVRKTLLYMLAGALISLSYSYLSGSSLESSKEIGESLIMGAFFGFFITNSPCSRGRC
ncbi:MAG: hypothetical protein OEY56_01375 [Cyclobacteriaceae bacterium]|nr:hypothetical protein [Cyclobacteriaceae bacterium]